MVLSPVRSLFQRLELGSLRLIRSQAAGHQKAVVEFCGFIIEVVHESPPREKGRTRFCVGEVRPSQTAPRRNRLRSNRGYQLKDRREMQDTVWPQRIERKACLPQYGGWMSGRPAYRMPCGMRWGSRQACR